MTATQQGIIKEGIRQLLQDPGTTATTLHAIALTALGSECYGQDVGGAELTAWLHDIFDAEIHEDNLNKLQAIILASKSDLFFINEEAFISVCNSVCGDDPGMQYADDLTMMELFLGVAEVVLNHPDPVPQFEPVILDRMRKVIARYPVREDEPFKRKNLIAVMSHIQLIKEELAQAGFSSAGLEDFAGKALLPDL